MSICQGMSVYDLWVTRLTPKKNLGPTKLRGAPFPNSTSLQPLGSGTVNLLHRYDIGNSRLGEEEEEEEEVHRAKATTKMVWESTSSSSQFLTWKHCWWNFDKTLVARSGSKKIIIKTGSGKWTKHPSFDVGAKILPEIPCSSNFSWFLAYLTPCFATKSLHGTQNCRHSLGKGFSEIPLVL